MLRSWRGPLSACLCGWLVLACGDKVTVQEKTCTATTFKDGTVVLDCEGSEPVVVRDGGGSASGCSAR